MRKALLAIGALAPLALALPTQAAVVISFSACVPGSLAVACSPGAPITSGSPPILSLNPTSVGAFTISGSAETGTTGTSAFFNSQTLQISSTTGGLLDIFATVSGVPTQGQPLVFTSSFTSNQQNADTHSVIESTFLNNGSGNITLASATLNNPILQTAGPFSTTETPAATVSLTHLYQIELIGCADQSGGSCTGNLTIDLSAAQVGASEPSALAVLGGGLLSLGLLTTANRRRRH